MAIVRAEGRTGPTSFQLGQSGDAIPFQIRESGISTHNEPIARDLVRIAATVHLADRQVRRNLRSGYRPRRFDVTIPVSSARRWQPVGGAIEAMAAFASQDIWRVRFRTAKRKRSRPHQISPSYDVVALFSGGLDSLCGAAYLAPRGQRVLLLTHSPPGRKRVLEMVASFGETIGGKAPSVYSGATISVVPQLRGPTGSRNMFQEFSRRSRPFLYLSLASAAVIAAGASRVQMSENGALGASLPFRKSHYGPRITRQGHSYMLEGFEEILSRVRPEMPRVRFVNPFSETTKGEACETLGAALAAARLTLSCEYAGQQIARLKRWARDRGRIREAKMARQCGLCVPCIVRRAALQRAGIDEPEGEYFFSAPRMLRANRAAREPFGREEAPPLYHFASVHPFYAARYAEEILSMKIGQFALQYLPELSVLRPSVSSRREMKRAFDLQRRFAQELLDFLNE